MFRTTADAATCSRLRSSLQGQSRRLRRFDQAYGAIALACCALTGCSDGGGWKEVPASCVRISTGDKLTGSALIFDGEIKEYHMHDQNGIFGKINSENSSSYRCKAQGHG